MSRVLNRLKVVAEQVRAGEIDNVKADISGWINSSTDSVGLRRDFTKTYDRHTKADVPLTAVALDETIAKVLFDTDGLKDRDKQFLDRRRQIWDEGFKGAYVAVDPDGQPAYLQWFIPHTQASKVKAYWGPLFPDYGADTLIVEGAWIPPAFRKKNVFGEALWLVSEVAKANSPDVVRYATCYPEAANKGAVLGTHASGYDVFEKRTETWKYGRRSVNFTPATEADFSLFDES